MFICDIHAHVLPGIDDGAADWEMSLAMVQSAWKAGVSMIVATPHYLPWKKDNHVERIEPLCRELMLRCQQKLGIDMEILPGQEIYYHSDVVEALERGDILTLANSRYVLVEFETGASGQKITDGLKRISQAGYHPILAHMERYTALRSGDWLQELKQRDILLQMNMEAIEGPWYRLENHWCRQRLTDGTIDLMGSDMHNMSSRKPMQKDTLLWIKKHVDYRRRKRLLGGLPR